ncbi:unnamed protein product [Polarella glacialis]|uniref:Uncharacterized protein n=1 Tax=Polarella glacialis TaxID=89957 RepID=A0A813FG01_POLGL|nr:unnamed protein product [Polarella glacialis]
MSPVWGRPMASSTNSLSRFACWWPRSTSRCKISPLMIQGYFRKRERAPTSASMICGRCSIRLRLKWGHNTGRSSISAVSAIGLVHSTSSRQVPLDEKFQDVILQRGQSIKRNVDQLGVDLQPLTNGIANAKRSLMLEEKFHEFKTVEFWKMKRVDEVVASAVCVCVCVCVRTVVASTSDGSRDPALAVCALHMGNLVGNKMKETQCDVQN